MTPEDPLEDLIRRRASTTMHHAHREAFIEERLRQEDNQGERLYTFGLFGGDLESKLLLEVGSGMGGLVVRLGLEGVRAVGLEYSYDYCQMTRLRGRRHSITPPVVNGAGEALPFRDGIADIAVAYEVSEHVADPRQVLAEMGRVLAPDGMVFVDAHNRWTPYDTHYHLWAIGYLPRRWADWLLVRSGRGKPDRSAGRQRLSEMHYFTWRRWRQLCEDLGFEVTDVREAKLRQGARVRLPGPFRAVQGPLLRALERSGLLLVVYRLYRATIVGGFHVVLRKRSRSG